MHAWPCDANAALVHATAATVDAMAKAICDVRCVVRDEAITISCDEELSEDTDGSLCGLKTVLQNRIKSSCKMLLCEAGTSSRDAHSCLWRRYSLHIHVHHSSFDLRCGEVADSIGPATLA
jgi:hypothetical protein